MNAVEPRRSAKRWPRKCDAPESVNGQLVNLSGSADTALQRSLDPGVVQRAVLAREVDTALRLEDRVLKRRLLLRRKQRERPARPTVAVPGMRRADLELASDLRVDA